MAGIGWYGPLIDLSAASSHLGAYVQLLVFVHQFHPPQRLRASNGRELLKAMLQVGDNTQPYFHVYLWQKHVYSNVSAGDVILLQNVKVTKFRDVAMATTTQHSSLSILVQSHELHSTKGMDETIEKDRIGIAMKEKLRVVIGWANHTQSTLLSYLDAMRGHNEEGTLGHPGTSKIKSELLHLSQIYLGVEKLSSTSSYLSKNKRGPIFWRQMRNSTRTGYAVRDAS